MFAHMLALQDLAFEAIRPGARCRTSTMRCARTSRSTASGRTGATTPGHAIGLRYHEGPFLDSGDDTEIRPGMVFTVEPGLYSPELGGFRHSDTVLVTEVGNRDPHVLPARPREPDHSGLSGGTLDRHEQRAGRTR